MNDASAVVTRERTDDPKAAYRGIEALVTQRREDIVTTLPKAIDPDHFIAVALQAVTRQPRLLECTPLSIVKALRDAAEVGLEPSGLMGMAYLVPYKNGRVYEAQFQAGYRGLIALARWSGEVQTFEARVVRQRDFFEFEYGSNEYIRHRPYMNLTAERAEDHENEMGEMVRGQLLDAGEYVAAFARAVLTGGQETFDVMSIAEVNAIRARSKARDSGPWVTDYAEMARKTIARRLLKYLPLQSAPLQKALEMEDAFEGQSVRVEAQPAARAAIQASVLGAHAAPDAPERTEPDVPAEAVPVTEAEDNAPQEATAGVCGDVNGDAICQRRPDHTGAHADEAEVHTAESVWPRS